MAENVFVTAVETERKFVIEMPDLATLAGEGGYTVDIMCQDYLLSPHGVTHRVRRRERAGDVRYFETVKRKIAPGSSEESEREIDSEQYEKLLLSRDPSRVSIRKTRHSFSYQGRVFEIDVYPEWERSCIMEVELPSLDSTLSIPPFIRILSDVTGDVRFSNASMARAFPPELI